MKKIFTTLLLALPISAAFAQYKMRTVDEWINRKEPAWAVVKQWIKAAKNNVEILPVNTVKAKDALYKTQVTTRSVMGAIVFSTGGILIENGWIRILGSDSSKMQRTLPDWNKGKAI